MFQSTLLKNRSRFAVIVALVWGALVIYGFWHFSLRHYSALTDFWVSFDGLHIETKVPPSERTRIVHLVDIDCPCSRFSRPHVDTLFDKYTTAEQIVVVNGKANKAVPEFLHDIVEKVPASPAVLVFSTSGELAYFGPYTSGAVCGQGDDLIAPIIADLQHGNNPRWVNQEAVGCFCEWPHAPDDYSGKSV